MKRGCFILYLFVFMCSKSHAQIEKGNLIFRSDSLKGVSFNMYYPLNVHDSKDYRWTPELDDIKNVENSIHNFFLHECRKKLINQDSKNCPIIKENLSKYFRQYMGVITKKGEKVIEVNFIWNDVISNMGDVYSNWIEVQDGCSKYWSIKVNVKKMRCFDLQINGF